MKKILYLSLALLALAGCNSAARKAAAEAAAEQARLDSLAAAEEAAAAKAKANKAAAQLSQLPQEPVFDIATNMGTIKVKLYKDTPKHRDNFAKLAISGYYDGLLFHRVINGFMIQGGDPYSRDTSKVDLLGQGGPDYTIPAEMRDGEGAPLHRHKKGALAAARRGDQANPYKESSGSQFYLVQNADACIHLDGEYTVFGETVAGLNVIDRIAAVETDRRDRPENDVKILSIRPDAAMNKLAREAEEAEKLEQAEQQSADAPENKEKEPEK